MFIFLEMLNIEKNSLSWRKIYVRLVWIKAALNVPEPLEHVAHEKQQKHIFLMKKKSRI